MTDKLLYSIEEIFTSCIKGVYTIPAYQRGYKWEKKDVKRLIEDIYEFDASDEDMFYCLQNITLIVTNNDVEVVDGQQRLTTSMILLTYLGKQEIVKNKIIFSVREQTNSFVQDILLNSDEVRNSQNWDEFIETHPECNRQDIFYMYQAFKACDEWFSEHDNVSREEMLAKTLNSVKMIVNRQKGVHAQELFENLNGKRVPLDGADLVRALIITRIAKKETADFEDDAKRTYLLEEQRIKLGLQLDSINQWWAVTEHKQYFDSFIGRMSEQPGATIRFNSDSHPINYLYKLYLLSRREDYISMDYFERNANDSDFLNQLIDLHRTMVDWYEDKEIYHLAKYVLIYTRTTFSELYNTKWKTNSRKNFIIELKNVIHGMQTFKELLEERPDNNSNEPTVDIANVEKNAELDEEALVEVTDIVNSEDWYKDELIAVSVLLDIISFLENTKSSAVLPPLYFKRHNEDLEHIFPQTPIAKKIKDYDKQTEVLKAYVELVNKSASKDKDKIVIDYNAIDWHNEEWVENTKELINNKVKKIIPIGCLGNMCVLDSSVNRSYGNDHFQEKRIDIMQKQQEGVYIRPHVLEAFNKSFAKRQEGYIDFGLMNNWTSSDIRSRREAIVAKLSNFLTV